MLKPKTKHGNLDFSSSEQIILNILSLCMLHVIAHINFPNYIDRFRTQVFFHISISGF